MNGSTKRLVTSCCVVGLLLASALACNLPQQGTGEPGEVSIVIDSPANGTTIVTGQEVLIQSTATASGGTARVELSVNGMLVRVDPPPSGNPSPFSIAQPWRPAADGTYTIQVVAYDVDNQASAPAMITLIASAPAGAGTSQPTPTSGPTQTPVPDVQGEGGCTLNASFAADVTVPDRAILQPNTHFVKTWRLRNSGTCAWEQGVELVWVGREKLGAPDSVAVEATGAGETVEVSVEMVAPTAPGTYQSDWRLRSENGQYFGGTIYVLIVVPSPATTTPTAGPSPTPTRTPTPTGTAGPDGSPDLLVASVSPASVVARTGATFSVAVQVRNGGSGAAPTSTLQVSFPPVPEVRSVVIPALASGASYTATVQYTYNTPQMVTPQAQADATLQVAESDESNNSRTFQVIVDPPDNTVGDGVIPQTYSLDLDGDGSDDVRWEAAAPGSDQHLLTPLGSTQIAVLPGSGELHYVQVAAASLGSGAIAEASLPAGTLVGVRTGGGYNGYIRIAAYQDRDGGNRDVSIYYVTWRKP